MTETLNLIDMLAKELEEEGTITRRMLERVPTAKFDWQPHTKSMKIKELTTHIADLPSWIGMGLNTEELDFAQKPYNPRDVNSTEELLAYFDENLAESKVQLANATEDQLQEQWTLREGDAIYMSCSRAEVIRHTLSQIIHHRAQLGVYLRLLDIPIPGTYGPSADDQQNFS